MGKCNVGWVILFPLPPQIPLNLLMFCSCDVKLPKVCVVKARVVIDVCVYRESTWISGIERPSSPGIQCWIFKGFSRKQDKSIPKANIGPGTRAIPLRVLRTLDIDRRSELCCVGVAGPCWTPGVPSQQDAVVCLDRLFFSLSRMVQTDKAGESMIQVMRSVGLDYGMCVTASSMASVVMKWTSMALHRLAGQRTYMHDIRLL